MGGSVFVKVALGKGVPVGAAVSVRATPVPAMCSTVAARDSGSGAEPQETKNNAAKENTQRKNERGKLNTHKIGVLYPESDAPPF